MNSGGEDAVDALLKHELETTTSGGSALQKLVGKHTSSHTGSSYTSQTSTAKSAWHGAEAFHLFLMAHRQLSRGRFDAALRSVCFTKSWTIHFLMLLVLMMRWVRVCELVGKHSSSHSSSAGGHTSTVKLSVTWCWGITLVLGEMAHQQWLCTIAWEVWLCAALGMFYLEQPLLDLFGVDVSGKSSVTDADLYLKSFICVWALIASYGGFRGTQWSPRSIVALEKQMNRELRVRLEFLMLLALMSRNFWKMLGYFLSAHCILSSSRMKSVVDFI